jgi:hypothetical protein
MALALCLFALFAALLPAEGQARASVPAPATWAALLALVLASSTGRPAWPSTGRPAWPWRGPNPLRETLALGLLLLPLALLARAALSSEALESAAHAAWIVPATTTLMLMSDVVSARGGWLSRVVLGFLTGFGWALWYSSLGR